MRQHQIFGTDPIIAMPKATYKVTIPVSVGLLLNDFDEVLERVAPGAVDDDGGGQVAQDVRAHGLDGVQVSVNKYIISFFNI